MANDQPIIPPPPAGFVPDSQPSASQGVSATVPPPPPGFVPDSQSAPKQAEPSFWDKTKHAIGQVFSATPEGAGSATSGAAAPELATQFKKDAEASEGPDNKLTGAGVIVGGVKSAMEVPQTIGHFIAPNTFSAHPEALQTKGTAETAGKIGENVLEFMAGDEALKSLSLGQKYTKLAKIATLLEEHPALAKAVEIGGNAIRAGAVGGTQTLAHGGTPEEAAASAAGGAVGSAATEGLMLALPAATKTVLNKLGFGLTSEEAFQKAGRASVREEPKMLDALETAKQPLVEAAQTTKIKSVGDFEDMVHDAAQKIRQEKFQPMIDRHADEVVSGSPISKNIRDAITPQIQRYDKAGAETMEEFAKEFSRDMPLTEAEQDLQYFNSKLKDLYAASRADQAAALKNSAPIAMHEAAADGLRDLIYGKLRELGENAPEELQQQYGALKTIERVFAKRATVADRQAPMTWAEVHAALAAVGIAGQQIMAGHPLGAIAAAGLPIAAHLLKDTNAPATLIKRGLKAAAEELTPKVPSTVGPAIKSVAPAVGGATGAQVGQWVSMILSNGQKIEVHPEDKEELLRRDPGAKVGQ